MIEDIFDRIGKKSREFWTQREFGNEEYASAYWATRTSGLRKQIAETVCNLTPHSVLEVGCHCGPNLWALRQMLPESVIVGTEISSHIAQSGRILLGDQATIFTAAAHNLSFQKREFDVVLTCGTLLCIGPAMITKSLKEIARVCGKFLVIAEPWSSKECFEDYPNTRYWLRDYSSRMRRFGFSEVFRKEAAEPMGHINSVLVMKRL